MNLGDFTPFITLFGPLAIVGTILDYAVRDEHKARVWEVLVSTARLAQKPFSVWFYGLVTVSSLVLTLALLSISGLWDAQIGGSGLNALKSSGPLLLAVVMKIFIIDYLLALKTYFVVQELSKPPEPPLQPVVKTTLRVSIIAGDLFLTALITGMFLNWSELFQAQHIPTDTSKLPATAKTLVDFFDTINFMAKESVQKSFYALNGSLFMYGALFVARLAGRAESSLNVSALQAAVFKVLAGCLTLIGIVLLVARQAVS